MGQAKFRQQQNDSAEKALLAADIHGISRAIRKLALAASERYGADCYLHAVMAQSLLKDQGVDANVVAGYAGWRVGEGDGDVVLHAKVENMVPQPGAHPYHAWLTCGRYILDFTTYQLKFKAESLDALDGGHTHVDWCPDYLMETSDKSRPMKDVTQLHAGMFHYFRDQKLEQVLFANSSAMDAQDLEQLRIIYANPEIEVYGPGSRPGM